MNRIEALKSLHAAIAAFSDASLLLVEIEGLPDSDIRISSAKGSVFILEEGSVAFVLPDPNRSHQTEMVSWPRDPEGSTCSICNRRV